MARHQYAKLLPHDARLAGQVEEMYLCVVKDRKSFLHLSAIVLTIRPQSKQGKRNLKLIIRLTMYDSPKVGINALTNSS